MKMIYYINVEYTLTLKILIVVSRGIGIDLKIKGFKVMYSLDMGLW